MKNIFGKKSSVLLAGALAFSFASCDTDTRSGQSTKDAVESQYDDGRTAGGINQPDITYGQGEHHVATEPEADPQAGLDHYGFEDRDQLIERVRNDLNRAQQSMEQLNQQMEEGEDGQETRQEWDETRRDLQQRQQDLEHRLGEAEQTTEDNWEQVRNDINQSLNELEQEWEQLRQRDDIQLEDRRQDDPNVDPTTEMGTQGGTQDHTNNPGAQSQP